jgi:hypothetical protein
VNSSYTIQRLRETRNLLLAYESPLPGDPRTVRLPARSLEKQVGQFRGGARGGSNEWIGRAVLIGLVAGFALTGLWSWRVMRADDALRLR